MAEIYFDLLIWISFGIIVWELRKPEKVYQYPFITASIFIAFIIPQGIALLKNPGTVVSSEALARVFLMSCLCISMAWLGYQLPINFSLSKKLSVPLDEKRVFIIAMIFVLIGYIATILILRLPVEMREASRWTGIITIYNFFRQLIFPGFAILLIFYLKYANFSRLSCVILSSPPIISNIIFEGRREVTIAFSLVVCLSLYFVKKITVPRGVSILALLIITIAIPLVGQYRAIAESGNWDQLNELKPVESFTNYIEEGKILELRNAAIVMDATVKTGQYGYGLSYWNSFVTFYIPGQLVGTGLKKRLKIQLQDYSLEEMYDYTIHFGTTIPAVGDTFVEFDYLGCLFFAILAYMFKTIWYVASYQESILAQFIYIYLLPPTMVVVTHGSQRFVHNLVFILIIVFIVNRFASQKKHEKFRF